MNVPTLGLHNFNESEERIDPGGTQQALLFLLDQGRTNVSINPGCVCM